MISGVPYLVFGGKRHPAGVDTTSVRLPLRASH